MAIKFVLLFSLTLASDAIKFHSREQEVPLSEYEKHVLGGQAWMNVESSDPDPDQIEFVRNKAGEVPKQVSVLSGKHVVMIGDSITRYQYLNLAHHIAHGSAPTFEFYEKKYPSNVTHSDYGFSWENWYRSTNHVLNAGEGQEICDCYRKQCCSDTFENRYFTDRDKNIHLTYVQWFRDNISFKGHWSPSMGYPIKQSCVPGLCGPPASWDMPQANGLKEMLQDFVMTLEPPPTHVVMNRGKWGHLNEGQFSDLLEEGQHIMQSKGVSFTWKTSTHSLGDCCSEADITAKEIKMAREHGWNVFDLYNLTGSFPPKLYNNNKHFTEVASSYFNHVLLTMF